MHKIDEKKAIKTICVSAVTAFLLLTALSVLAGTIENTSAEDWKDNAAGSFAGGTGTAENPYRISNGEQLAYLGVLVNSENSDFNNSGVYYVLTNDIYLNDTKDWKIWSSNVSPKNKWTRIGTSTTISFKANLDGRGHVVRGIYIKESGAQGLFGYVSGTVCDLGVEEGYIEGGQNTGAVAGYADTGAVIDNCHNTVKVSGTAGRVAGIAGYNQGMVSNCYNTGAISSNQYVAGIVGRNEGTVLSCYNAGDITGSATTSYTGGVVGYNTGKVTNAYNTGAVSGQQQAGGIVGHNSGDITVACNTGKVSGSGVSNYVYAGGIVGHSTGKITNVYNMGEVSSSTSNNLAHSGGIVGYNSGSIINAYNTGTISGDSTDSNVYAGGIVGRTLYGAIRNVYNTGTISGDSIGGTAYVGGIVGNIGGGSVSNGYFLEGSATDAVGYTAGGTASNVFSFSDIGEIDGTVTISGFSGTNELLTALNNYVQNENKSVVSLLYYEETNDLINDCVWYPFVLPTYTVTILVSNGTDTLEEATVGYTLNEVHEEDITDANGKISFDVRFGYKVKIIDVSLDGYVSSGELTMQIIVGDKTIRVFLKETPEYTVTFDSNGGSACGDAIVLGGKPVAAPTAPTKPGYKFAGWFTADGKEWNFDTLVTDDVTLYAKWTYDASAWSTVTFEPDNGTDPWTADVPIGESVTAPSVPMKQGYKFEGWYTADGELWIFAAAVNGNITLHAEWTYDTSAWSTVTFESNGGSVCDDVTVLKGDYVKEPSVPTRPGYKFAGWYTADSVAWNFADAVNESITLHAKWTYDADAWSVVTFDAGEGSPSTSKDVVTGDAVTAPSMPTRPGYKFAGWFTAADEEWDFDYPVTEDITLYAEWTYDADAWSTVIFDANGGSPSTSVDVPTGTPVGVPSTPTKPGYKFAGWFTESGVEWNFSSAVTDDVTLHAEWTYDASAWSTVTFVPGNGTDPWTEEVLIGKPVSVPSAPARAGYTFAGWFTASGVEWNFAAAVNESITLRAEWKELVTFDIDIDPDVEGGTITVVTPGPYVEGDSVIITLTPDKGRRPSLLIINGKPVELDDANFDDDGVYTHVLIVNEDVTVSAVFEKIFTLSGTVSDGNGNPLADVLISYTVDDGTEVFTRTDSSGHYEIDVSEGSIVNILSVTKYGYEVAGEYETTGSFLISISVNEDMSQNFTLVSIGSEVDSMVALILMLLLIILVAICLMVIIGKRAEEKGMNTP